MDMLSNDTAHISLDLLYRSAKIDCAKKTFEYIVPPLLNSVGTAKLLIEHCCRKLL